MIFGERVRLLRLQCSMTHLTLAQRLDVSMSYISKVERARLHFGDNPSEKFIRELADELGVNVDELLTLADKVPVSIRERIREKPDVFRVIAMMDDDQLDHSMGQFGDAAATSGQ